MGKQRTNGAPLMTGYPNSRLTRRRPRDFREWQTLRQWGKLPQRESQQPGYLLRTIRQNAGLTQNELAERLSITQQAVSQAERWNANPTAEMMFSWALACGRQLELCFNPSPGR